MKIKSALTAACMAVAATGAAQASDSFHDALTGGKLKGSFGIYFENFVDQDQSKNADGYANSFLTLKYETAKWNNFQFGVTAHNTRELYDENNDFNSDHESASGTDRTLTALAEAYVKYHFNEDTHAVLGRFNHKKVTLIDDAQSEGGYIQFNGIDNLKLNAGFMTQFAELDYDDFEDFGRQNGSQDLKTNSATDDYMIFVDGTYKINDNASIRPYFYSQGDYASVFGANANVKGKIGDTGVGARIAAYTVDADEVNVGADMDSDVFGIFPYVKVAGVKIGVGYAEFGKGLARPFWFKDHLTKFDQDFDYPTTATADVEATQATVEFKVAGVKVRYGIQDWEADDNSVDSREQELLLGYKFTKKFDLSLRFFDVEDKTSTTGDYQKVESRLRYKF